ncbi:MAG: hypothetical protein Q8O56_00775 [Solirubrobacteraceae bacterium]|nr:hypothetical protein [Solirubrobacteraceae bacterium]
MRNGTTSAETQIISNIRTTARPTGGYSMRMSNLSSTGGGFINGCRASAAATSKPCYRANNLSTGRAFELSSRSGAVVGTITAGAGGDTKKPLTTNATGVATGFNADRVDGLHAAEIIAAARTKAGLDADTLDGVDSSGFLQYGGTIPSGTTIRGIVGGRFQNGPNVNAGMGATASFPIPAPVPLANANVEVAPSANCTGSTTNVIAAPGFVCVYPSIIVQATAITANVGVAGTTTLGFQMEWNATVANSQSSVRALWAYTAP